MTAQPEAAPLQNQLKNPTQAKRWLGWRQPGRISPPRQQMPEWGTPRGGKSCRVELQVPRPPNGGLGMTPLDGMMAQLKLRPFKTGPTVLLTPNQGLHAIEHPYPTQAKPRLGCRKSPPRQTTAWMGHPKIPTPPNDGGMGHPSHTHSIIWNECEITGIRARCGKRDAEGSDTRQNPGDRG